MDDLKFPTNLDIIELNALNAYLKRRVEPGPPLQKGEVSEERALASVLRKVQLEIKRHESGHLGGILDALSAFGTNK